MVVVYRVVSAYGHYINNLQTKGGENTKLAKISKIVPARPVGIDSITEIKNR